MTSFKALFQHLPGRTEENHKTPNQDIQFLGLYLNLECDAGLLNHDISSVTATAE
jgi:hypothetical protein